MHTHRDRIEAILAGDKRDDEEDEISKCELIDQLIPLIGWEAVRTEMLRILESERRLADWKVAAGVIWGAVLDGRPLPVDRMIALLYHRFDPTGDHEDNLAWSIASKLKGVGYLSEYKPLDDPLVRRELESLRNA